MQKYMLVVVVAFAFLVSTIFIVNETDKAFLVRLGGEVSDSSGEPIVYDSGIHFKFPIIDTVRTFDIRLNTFDAKIPRVTTLEKKYVVVDFFVQWRIDDLPLFFKRNKASYDEAKKRLNEISIEALRGEFGKRTIQEVVSGERIELMEKLKTLTGEQLNTYGIEVVDVRIKRIDLTDEVSESVFERMRSERRRVASEIRSEGNAEATKVRADADKFRKIKLSEADRDAKKIRGEGDAKAIEIYANSYNQSPEFFEFYRSIEAYKKSFSSKDDIIILKPDSEFFKFFNNSVSK